MRDYTGIHVPSEDDPARREKFARIDYYLRDLSRGMERIQKGEIPDGSGDTIINQVISDIYWVLLGRSGGQIGYGGTLSGENATLASTTHSTKGKVFLGAAQQTAYDEVNERVGVNQPAPAAKLDIYQTADGTITRKAAGDNGTGGTKGYYEDDPTLGPTYIGGQVPGITYWGIYTSSGGSVVPVYHTGWQNVAVDDGYSSYIAAHADGGADFTLDGSVSSAITWTVNVRITNLFGGALPADLTLSVYLVCSDLTRIRFSKLLSGNITTSWTTLALTGGVVVGTGSVANSTTIFIDATDLIYPYVAITYFEFVSSSGGLSSTPLQKWEVSSGPTNSLNYAADGAGTTTLQLSGTPPLRLTTAPEFDVGTPAVGQLWKATDTEGTGAWSAASAIATTVQHRWEANGPYRVETEVDGAYIATKAITLSRAVLYRRNPGGSGSLTVDLKKNGVTMFSAKPSLLFSAGASATALGTLSVSSVAQGDRLTVNTDASDGGQDWALMIEGA